MQIPLEFERDFINAYEAARGLRLPTEWRKMIRIQDLTNLVGLLNTPYEYPKRIKDITQLIENTLKL